MSDADPPPSGPTPAYTPPAPPVWTPDPNETYSTRGVTDPDGTQRLYTAAEAAALFPAPTLDALKAAKKSAAQAQFAARLAAGLPYEGQVIDIDDASRSNLGGMALTAALALQNVQPWPALISRGWISRSGVRIALPQPADGLALANAAAGLYSELAQHEQDIEDAADAATDTAGVAAVDETAGWPANASTAPT